MSMNKIKFNSPLDVELINGQIPVGQDDLNVLAIAVYDTTRVQKNLYDVSRISRDTVLQKDGSDTSDTEYRRDWSTSNNILVKYGDVMCFLFNRETAGGTKTPFTVKFYSAGKNYAPIEVMEGVPIIVPKGANYVRFYSETEVMDNRYAEVQFGIVSHNFDGVEEYPPLVEMVQNEIGKMLVDGDEVEY